MINGIQGPIVKSSEVLVFVKGRLGSWQRLVLRLSFSLRLELRQMLLLLLLRKILLLLILLVMRLLILVVLLLLVRLLLSHVDDRLLRSSRPSNHLDTWEDWALLGLGCWFVEAGEDGEGEGGGGEDKKKTNLDQQVAYSHIKVTFIYDAFIALLATTARTAANWTPSILEEKDGHHKRSKGSEVEEGSEDAYGQESPLLALVGTASSRQAYDACDKAWNGDPKSLPEIDPIL